MASSFWENPIWSLLIYNSKKAFEPKSLQNITQFATFLGSHWKKYLPKVSWDDQDSIKMPGKLPVCSYRQYLWLNMCSIPAKLVFWGLIRVKLGPFFTIFAIKRLSSWCFDIYWWGSSKETVNTIKYYFWLLRKDKIWRFLR